MRESGIVVGERGNLIDVKILRTGACSENCAGCGACGGKEHIVLANNRVGAKTGDEVVLEMASQKLLSAAILVYIIPLVALAAGYYMASFFNKNDVFCAGTGFLFMIISFFSVHVYDKKKRDKYKPDAVLKISEQTEKKK